MFPFFYSKYPKQTSIMVSKKYMQHNSFRYLKIVQTNVSSAANQHNRMTSEASCDTVKSEGMAAENLALPSQE